MSPQVLVLGLPRSGTQSIAAALELLSYPKVYHMREVGKNAHEEKWISLLDARHKSSGKFQSCVIEEILRDYDAVTDFPATIFSFELLQIYPNARVILLTRDRTVWLKSMNATLIHAHTDPGANKVSPMRPLAEKYHRYCWDNDFARNGGVFYDDYLQGVRKETVGREVLEYRIEDGWDPLCRFLQRPKPDLPFPKHDDWLSYKMKT